jgi:hypothetical protein
VPDFEIMPVLGTKPLLDFSPPLVIFANSDTSTMIVSCC